MKASLTTSLLTGVLVSSHVSAQLLEEITVTAQKREQSIQDVGIAVTAFSGDQIQALGVTDNTDIAAQSPGVFISANNGGINQHFTIRGVTQNDNFSVAESPNALYIDEGYRPIVSQLSTAYDVERVEILKGPQATLFGRNATGGLIHYISKKPTNEAEGYVDLTYGNYDQVRVEGAASGPLSDSVSVRLAGIYRKTDPIMDNEFSASSLNALTFAGPGGPFVGAAPNIENDDAWADDQYSIRGQILFEPNDDLSVLVKVEDERSEPNSNPYGSLPTVAVIQGPGPGTIINALVSNARTNPNSCEALEAGTTNCRNIIPPLDGDFDGVRPTPNGDLFGYVDDFEDLDVSHNFAFADSNISESTGLNIKISWNLDWAELISVTTYADSFKRQALDVDAGPAPHLIVTNYGDVDWFTQELRLEGEADRFRWIAGLYYLEIDGEAGNAAGDTIGGLAAVAFNPAVVGTPGGGPGNFVEAASEGTVDTTSYSIFGQIDYDITDRLELNLGWRGTQEKKDFDGTTSFYANNNPTRVDGIRSGATELANLNSHSETLDDFLWSGVIKLNYQHTDDLLLYGGVTRGVKAGGCNAPLFNAATVSPENYCYDEEVLVSYEVGFKSTVWDGKARINATAYYYDYNDYQAFLFEGASGIVSNADAEYKGVELEVQASPTDRLDIILGVSYVDAIIDDLAIAPGIERDIEPTFTPDVQFNFVGRYTWPNAFGGAVTLQLDGNYAASSFHNLSNFDATKMDSYWLGNTSLSWKSDDGHWQVTGFVDNVFDERNQTTGFSLHGISGSDEYAFGLPRMYGARLRYNYF